MSDGTGDGVFVGFQPLDPDTLSTCKSPAKVEENDSNDNSLNGGKTSSKCDKSNEEKIPANGIQTKENDVEEESSVEKIKTLENKDVEVDKTKEVDSCSVKVNLKDNVLNVDNKSSTEHLKDKELELDSAVPVELGKECEKKLAQPDSDSCAGDMKSLFEEEDEKVCDKPNSVDDNSLEGSKNDVVKEVESKQQTNKPDKIKNGENKENILNTSGESSNSITKSENECVLPESDKILKIIPSATQNKEDDELPVDDCDSDDDKMVIDEDISENPLQPHLVNDSKLTGAKKRKQKLASRVIEDNEYDDMEVAEVNSEKDEKNESSELPPDPEDGDYIICPMTGERIQKVIPTAVVEIDNDDNVDPGNEVGEDNYSDDDYHPSMGDKILTKHPKKKVKNKRLSLPLPAKVVNVKDPGLFKGQKLLCEPELELFKRPFSLGWGREIVVRNASESGKKQMDTYYFTPEGKKLRSMVQVTDYLTRAKDINLTTANFSFARVPVYKEPFEVVRNAGKSKIGSPIVPNKKKRTESGTPPHKAATPKSDKKLTVQIVFKPKLPPNKKFKSEAARRAEKLAASDKNVRKRSADTSTDNEVPTKKQHISGKTNGELEFKPCSMKCSGLEGIAPDLQCNVCMCLCHPKCALVSTPPPAHFICSRCINAQLKEKPSVSRIVVKSKIVNEVNKTVCTTPATTSMPNLQYGKKANQAIKITPVLPPLPPLRPMTAFAQVKAQSVAGPPPLHRVPAGIPVQKTNILCARPIMSSPINPQVTPRTILPNKNAKGGEFMLPQNVIENLNLNEPLSIKISGQAFTVNPSCFVQTPEGIKIYLPPNTLAPSQTNKPIDIKILSQSPVVADVSSNVNKTISNSLTCMPLPLAIFPQKMDAVAADSKSVLPPRIIDKDIKQLKCCFHKLDSGFDCMVEIFSYLSIPDLLRVGKVCKRWRRVAFERSLWHTVMLKDCHVNSWNLAAPFLERIQTHTLDLRGAHHGDDRNRTWQQMTGVLNQLRFMECFHFGQCPASILHAVADKLVNLKVLTAEWITDVFTEPQMWSTVTKLDLGKFCQLVNLEEIRLRGICGLVLPALTTFTGGMSNLEALQNLRKLSMTTLKDIPDSEFCFIASLTNLEELELGDCDSWTDKTYACLGKLTKLKRLRLENGGCHPDLGLADALKNMNLLEQLQLMVFQLPDSLKTVLPEMSYLKKLSLWPDTRSQAALMNTNAMNAVKELKSLKFLEWCTMKNNDETSGSESKSVPFLSIDNTVNGKNSNPTVIYKSAKELAGTLKGYLPKTRIRVARLPVVSGLKKPDV